MHDIGAAVKAQAFYCKQKGIPVFAPRDGKCWSCGANVYLDKEHRGGGTTNGYSTKYAGLNLITGCPHCKRSFVD